MMKKRNLFVGCVIALSMVTTGLVTFAQTTGDSGATADTQTSDTQKNVQKNKRGAKKASALSDEEKAAAEATRDERKAEWDALTDEEKEAKRAEMQAERQNDRAEKCAMREMWDALSDEEKEAKIAEMKAKLDSMTDEEKAALKEQRPQKQKNKPSRVATEEQE